MLLHHVIFSMIIVPSSCFQIQSKLYNLLHSVLPQDESACLDLSEDCENRHGLCQNDAFREIMHQKCPKTCGYCDSEEATTPMETIEEETEQFTDNFGPTSTEIIVVETTTADPPEPATEPEPPNHFSIKRLIGSSAERLTEADDSEEVEEPEEVPPRSALRRYKKPCSDLADDCQAKFGLCTNRFYDRIMKRYCKRTCGFCAGSEWPSPRPAIGTRSRKIKGKSRVTNKIRETNSAVSQCLDRGVDCRDKSQLCTNRHYKKLMKKMCPVTCNMCNY